MSEMREFLPRDIYIDFVGKSRFFTMLSAVAVIASIVLFVVVGPNWSIDFTGGTEVQFRFKQPVQTSEVRAALAPKGISDDAIQQIDDPAQSRFVVRVQGKSGASEEETASLRTALEKAFGASWLDEFAVDAEIGTRARVRYTGEAVPHERIVAALSGIPGAEVQDGTEENLFFVRLPGVAEEVRAAVESSLGSKDFVLERTDSVGPRVGSNLRTAGIVSLSVTMLLLLVYVAVRFDFAYAPGAILCLFHDAVITCGIFVLTRQEFGLSMISALLTLVGYSLNDTIVIYDRIRENMEKYRRKQLGELINDSVNQMLGRSIMTSLATALALVPFLFFGGPVLKNFASAMLIGIVIGSYSTIYVASPLMILLKDNQDTIQRWFGLGPAKPAADASPKP